jgi:hypothetical protein
MPGFCFSGIHTKRTTTLIKKVENPIEKFVCWDNPCARTVQGDTPAPLAIRSDSPSPNKNNPNTKKTKVVSEGLRLKGSLELQKT